MATMSVKSPFLSCICLLLVQAVLMAEPVAPSDQGPQKAPATEIAGNIMQTLDDRNQLRVGDQISYRVMEDRDPPVVLPVLDSGEIEFPYVGRVKAVGKTCKQLAEDVQKMLEGDFYYKATVVIALDAMRQTRGKVYLFGGIAKQGPLDIPVDETFTLSKAILRSGGFADGADRVNVRIERKTGENVEDKQTIVVNMQEVLDQGRTDLDPVLQPNDLIVVPNAGSLGRVYVVGQVGRPGGVDIPGDGFTASKAILAAGGFQEFANKRKVKIVRKTGSGDNDKKEIIVDVAAVLEKGDLEKDVPLQAGDMVIVPERLINF